MAASIWWTEEYISRVSERVCMFLIGGHSYFAQQCKHAHVNFVLHNVKEGSYAMYILPQ